MLSAWKRVPNCCYRKTERIASTPGLAVMLNLHALREHQGILHINAKIANRCLDLGMAKQDLYGAQIAGLLVDEGCLRSA